jgi:hypothetical protein
MTQKQAKANRENAKQSTGPRTRSGKGRSSQNSIKHGLNQALDLEHDNRFIMLLRLVKEDGYPHDEAYSIISAILDHRRVMEAFYEQYHATKKVMIIRDIESDAEHCDATIGYNGTLHIKKIKVRVGRLNKLIRYQRRSIAQIRRITQEIKNDKTNPFMFDL